MSLCVVAIHTHPMENCSNVFALNIYASIVSLAVPFFFIASGFLLSIKLHHPYDSEESIQIVKVYAARMIKLYLLWSVIYMPLALYQYIYLDHKHSWLWYVASYMRGLIFIGEHYNSWILWYLLSTIYSLQMIIILLKKHVSLYGIAFIGAVIFLSAYLIDCLVSYKGPLPVFLSALQLLIRITIANGRIFRGMLYIPLGMLLAHKTFSVKIAYPLFVACFISTMLSNGIVKSISGVVCAVSLFVIVLEFQSDSHVYPFMRKMSTVIYFIHMYVWSIGYKILYGQKHYGLDMFLMTASVCLAVSFVYVYVSLRWERLKNYVH